MNIAILTSGGDCGGLNAVIKGAALAAHSQNVVPYLITNGYIGLYNLVDQPRLLELTPNRVDRIPLGEAGSEAGNSRLKIGKILDPNKYDRIRAGLKKFAIDCLLIAGGDDTGSVVVELIAEGIPCIHLPKTMDLDLQSYSVGGDSAINRIASFARDAITTARTHNRVLILEVFGRYAGHTALYGGLAGGADIILIPEIKVQLPVVYKAAKNRFMRRFLQSDQQSAYVLIVVAEGIRDASGNEIVDNSQPLDSFGHPKLIGAGKYIGNSIRQAFAKDPEISAFLHTHHQFVEKMYTVPEVRELLPSHLVRCGHSYAMDIQFGLQIGVAAIELVQQKIFGVTITSFRHGVISVMECKEAIVQNLVDAKEVAMYERLDICFGSERSTRTQTPVTVKKEKRLPTRPY